MKIYEMVFHKGIDESTHFFYSENSYASRQHFIELIRLDIDAELSNFKMTCLSDDQYDLKTLFEEVHKESHFHVDKMEAEFIRDAIATFDPCICLRVKERDVLQPSGNTFHI